MNKKYFKKIVKNKIVLIIIFLVVIGLYCNRSYARIYNYIDRMELKGVNNDQTYLIVNQKTASSSLTYVALGDSLTAGVGADEYSQSYPYLLAQYLAGNDYQINLKSRALPGAKTTDLLNILLPKAIEDNPDLMTLLIGVNDIHGQVSAKEFRTNYENILRQLTQETKAEIFVINIPFLGANNLLLPPYNWFFNFKTRQFNKIIQELATKYSVNYLNLYTPTESLFKQNGSHYAPDFFHPSAQGYKIWADLIYADFNN